MSTKVPLSKRIRPNSEAAPWVVDEVKELEAEIERLKKNDADRGQKVINLTMKHLGCLTVLNACRREVESEELKDRIDHALIDATTVHPNVDIHQMKSGDWWIEPRR